MAFVRHKAVKGVAAGIGLISESISAHKGKKESPRVDTSEEIAQPEPCAARDPSDDLNKQLDTEETPIDSLEAQWELDETQDELHHSTGNQTDLPEGNVSEKAVDEAIHRFASDHPPPAYTGDAGIKLPAPILLPQRRPKNRKRGFIRAYPPDLAAFSIDQRMFFEFLDTIEKACQGARWLNVINLASIGTMFMPSATGVAVSIAIRIATDVAISVDGARRTNTVFDKMNKEFFQPRGLFCLVMTWNPELANSPSTTVDLESMIFKSSDEGSDTLSRLRNKFKSSDGKTYGNIFPEVAPLIFPGLDELASDQDAAKKISKTKKKMEFVNEYWDKRAQAEFTAKNPDSHLAQGPTPTFTSRYADPEHPASSGDLLALVSGGHISREKLLSRRGRSHFERRSSNTRTYAPEEGEGSSSQNPPAPDAPYGRQFPARRLVGGIRDARGSRAEQRNSIGSSDSRRENDPAFGRRGKRDIGLLRPIAKLREQNVLYMAIVNMPSEVEMASARDAIGLVG